MPPTVTDQMDRQVEIPAHPKRIVSLVPSQTELLADLGLEAEVVGITKFCVHPQSWFRNKPRVGGTKKVKLEQVRQLQPDLIIGNLEENTEADIEALAAEFPVWMSDVVTVADALKMIDEVSEITGKAQEGKRLAENIRHEFDKLEKAAPVRTAYFIWQKPMMVVGHHTFIHTMLETWGVRNIFGDQPRYPETSLEELRQMEPELILLSSEPYPFKARHLDEFQQQFPQARIALVDGEIFSWYGSRMLQVPTYLNKLSKALAIGS